MVDEVKTANPCLIDSEKLDIIAPREEVERETDYSKEKVYIEKE